MCWTAVYDQLHTSNERAKRYMKNDLVNDELIDKAIVVFGTDMKKVGSGEDLSLLVRVKLILNLQNRYSSPSTWEGLQELGHLGDDALERFLIY